MKAVMSLWTAPMGGSLNPRWQSNWLSVDAHLAGWIKAFWHTKTFFDRVELVTDSFGADLLVEKIGIPFDSVSLALDKMNDVPSGIWSAGKIVAYGVQEEPFFHIDADCFLYKALPEEWLSAPIAAQNIESNDWFRGSYLKEIEHAEKVMGWLPSSWRKADWAPCMGVLAVNDLDWLQSYCKQANEWIRSLRNKEAWSSIQNQGCYSIIAEQWLGGCVAEEQGKEFTWLCKGGHIDKSWLESIGYCHLWGAKQDKAVSDHLIQVVARDHPKEFANAIRHINKEMRSS